MTVVVLSALIDTEITNNAPTFNYGARDDFHAGSNATATWKTLIKFDLSSIPASATINSATLSLFCTSEDSTTDTTINLHRALTQWFEGVKNGAAPDAGQDGSTWNLRNANGSVAWAGGAGGGSGSDYVAAITASFTITAPGSFFDLDVLTDVQGFVAASFTNHGWWLQRGSFVANSRKFFASRENATSANRPKLTIDYTEGFIEGSAAGTATATATVFGAGAISGTAAGTSTVVGEIVDVEQRSGTADGTSTAVATLFGVGTISGTAEGTSEATASLWANAVAVAIPRNCNPVPLLGITDGTVKPNGQLNELNFLSERAGFMLKGWRPQIAQYKDSGRFSNGPLAQGRRLRYRSFANAIEVFELGGSGFEQNAMIEYIHDLLAFQEAAADYWVSDYVVRPVYLFARAARETYTRYAMIHMISVPELENPYMQPFFDHNRSVLNNVTVRIERGHWTATPPGEFECVPVSSIRSWTVSGWEAGS